MRNIIITADVMGIIINCIIIYGSLFEVGIRNKKGRAFALYVLCGLINMAADATAWFYDGVVGMEQRAYIGAMLKFLLGYTLPFGYTRYVLVHISEKERIPRVLHFYNWSSFILATAFAVWGLYEGKLFYYKDGFYHDGPYAFIFLIIHLFIIAISLGVLFGYGKVIGTHDALALFMYILVPSIAVGINIAIPNLALIYPCSSLAMLLIYIMIQAETKKKADYREAILKEETNTDMLTGLSNRRAYTRLCKEGDSWDRVGVVFCDLNGLKYTNDTKGHEAGDKLLMKFSSMLLAEFRKPEIFRISGDEFVVIVPFIDQESFYKRITKLRNEIERCDFAIAAVGHAYGEGCELNSLIAEAEEKMYMDKDSFHAKNPELSRAH